MNAHCRTWRGAEVELVGAVETEGRGEWLGTTRVDSIEHNIEITEGYFEKDAER